MASAKCIALTLHCGIVAVWLVANLAARSPLGGSELEATTGKTAVGSSSVLDDSPSCLACCVWLSVPAHTANCLRRLPIGICCSRCFALSLSPCV